jgi:hypothetical protein
MSYTKDEMNEAIAQAVHAAVEGMQASMQAAMNATTEADKPASLQTSALTLKPQLEKPATYDGTRSASKIEGWLRSVERYAQLTRMTEDDQLLLAMILSRDRADIWIRTLEVKNNAPEDWTEFKEELKRFFKSVQSLRMARDNLAVHRQVGSVEDYIEKFQNLAFGDTKHVSG